MAYLSSLTGASHGKRTELDKNKMVMGRHPDCDLLIEAGAVSRQHARIDQVDGGYELIDLKSRNGTFLNGQLIDKPTRLSDGDLIRICDIEFSFHEPASQGSSELIIDSANFGTGFSTGLGANLSGSVSGSASGSFRASGSVSGSQLGILLVEDEQEARDQRAVQGKLDVRGSTYGVQLTTSAEVRLQAVLDITQNLGHSIRLEEVLPKVLDTLFRIFLQADRAFIVLIEDGELVPKWINTRNSEQQENFRISRTVMREVMDSKEAIISLDASSDERFEMAQSISGFRIRSMIVAPLLDSKGQAIGAIQMDSLDTSRQFQKGDLEILASIAVQAGIAIDNAQLHDAMLERTKVQQDLELARQVQRAFLPSRVPEVAGYQLYDFYRPADQVGGDYFDYILLGNDQLVIVVADVVGHGVAAAMLMAKLSAETRYCLASRHELADAVSLLNHRLMDMNLKRFVTLLCLKLDLTTGQAEIVNAGHMLPIWYQHQSQTVQEPGDDEAGSPLGIVKSEDYVSAKLQLEIGDELLLYTDGISEAPNAQGAQYGTPRLRQLAGSSAGDITRLGQLVIDDLDVFTKDTRQADDMCLVILRRTG